MKFDELPFEKESNEELPFAPANESNTPEESLEKTEELFEFDTNAEELKKDNDEIFTPVTTEEPKQEKILDLSKLKQYVNILPVTAFLFVSFLGIYTYVLNANAQHINLIKIEEKNKIGYINNEGTVMAEPKYIYGTDFYNGYAIVKNYNNLYGVLNGKAKLTVPFGNLIYVELYDDRYIASKYTKQGLKQGLLDSKLDDVTDFKYDTISYSRDGLFLFTRDKTMGIMNNEGKEIYTYVVSDIDDRNVSIEVSDLTNFSDKYQYASIKINDSSTIVNTKTGKEVYKYTLSEIKALDNNVFYMKNSKINNRYIVINNDKVIYETNDYKRLRIEDINSDIAIGIKEDGSYDYIDLVNKNLINSNENIEYTYSDGVILSKTHNFANDKDKYEIYTPKEKIGEFTDLTPVDNTFVNGYSIIKTNNNKYSYINKKGKLVTSKEYDEVSDFTKNGFSKVCNDDGCGVINSKGKEIIKLKYDDIVMLDDELFSNVRKKTNEELFIFKVNDRYGIVNSKGKIVVKSVYDSFETITTKYPIIKGIYEKQDILINLDSYKSLSIKIKNDLNLYENYIVSDNTYYNYDGKIIYKSK